MKNYIRSICSTCKYHSNCSLTTDMSTISSCSEYVHYLEKYNVPPILMSIGMHSNNEKNNELVLN